MSQEIKIIAKGSIYFFYRPKMENKEDIQRFFFILKPEKSLKYYLLMVGKKHLPAAKKNKSYFLFVDKVSTDKKTLLESLSEKHYSTKTRGERTQPTARC